MGVLVRGDAETQGDSCGKPEAEIGATWPRARACQVLPWVPGGRQKRKEGPSLEPSKGVCPCHTAAFDLVASEPRGNDFLIASPSVWVTGCDSLLRALLSPRDWGWWVAEGGHQAGVRDVGPPQDAAVRMRLPGRLCPLSPCSPGRAALSPASRGEAEPARLPWKASLALAAPGCCGAGCC